MRSAGVIVAAAVLGACGAFGSGDAVAPDGGSGGDASSDDGGVDAAAGDAGGRLATEDLIACGLTQEQNCASSGGNVCCHVLDKEPTCKLSALTCTGTGAWIYRCDDSADCPSAASTCCFGSDGASCRAQCGGGAVVCANASDCPSSTPCSQYNCDGRVRGFCSDPNALGKVTRCNAVPQ